MSKPLECDLNTLKKGTTFFAGCGNTVSMWCEYEGINGAGNIVGYVINGGYAATFDVQEGKSTDEDAPAGMRIISTEQWVPVSGSRARDYNEAISWCQERLAGEA